MTQGMSLIGQIMFGLRFTLTDLISGIIVIVTIIL